MADTQTTEKQKRTRTASPTYSQLSECLEKPISDEYSADQKLEDVMILMPIISKGIKNATSTLETLNADRKTAFKVHGELFALVMGK